MSFVSPVNPSDTVLPARWGRIATLSRWFLVGVWIAASIAKAFRIDQLDDMVLQILPFGGAWPYRIAIAVIALEFVAGIGLVFRATRYQAAMLSCFMGTGFVMVNLIRMIEGLKAPCSCFGILFTFPPAGALALDILVIAAALTVGRAATSASNI